jgi:hypothetical protein
MNNTITYATNDPSEGYELMISGQVPERFDLEKYTHVWVDDGDGDEAPDWVRFPATA